MGPGDQVEQEVAVRGLRCKVTARRVKGRWTASGTFLGRLVEVHRAPTQAQAFEWWANKAGMQQPDG